MSCPAPEDLSRWIDGSAEPAAAAAAARHAEACAACRGKADGLRAAARWLETVAEPGADCLSPDDMAALIEGRGTSAHVQVCPRCAAEYQALRPPKKATRRLFFPARAGGPSPWIAAAAALLMVAVGIAVVTRAKKPAPGPTTPATARKAEPAPTPTSVPPREERTRLPDNIVLPPRPPAPAPLPEKPVPPPPTPAPKPDVPAPPVQKPEPAPPKPAPPKTETVVEPERKAVAVAVKTGALAELRSGKWVKTARVEEGLPVRAEGRVVCEFAGANVTIEASSKVDFQGFDIALHEGALSAEVAPGASFALTLDARRIEPMAAASRVLLVARPDRVIVEEGAAKIGADVLHQGVEYALRKDRMEVQKRRSLPAAARPREIPTWKLDFSQPAVLRLRILTGRVLIEGDERMVAASPLGDNPFWESQVGYFTGDVEKPFFIVKPSTTLRFRYFLSKPAELELVLKNMTKDENYNKPFPSVTGRWTTVTIPVREIPPNRGGKQFPCDLGDKYVGWGIFCGRPGSTAQLYVDQFEIVEVDR
ncbi:MAG TPA: hypothetical protein VF950_10360 [Planctomycetota bacterium]